MTKLKKKVVINRIGITVYNPEESYKFYMHYLADAVQGPFNYFDDRILSLKK